MPCQDRSIKYANNSIYYWGSTRSDRQKLPPLQRQSVNRVTGVGTGPGVTGRPKAAANRPASGFSVDGDDPASAIQENQPAQSVLLSGMLALQEVETGNVQDKAARRHGIALLEALSQLQKALLLGLGDSEAEVEALALLTTETPEPADPGLAAALAAIRLRAKIELLRQGIEIT